MVTKASRLTGTSLTRRLTLASAIAALYALLVSILPATSIPIVQVRVADVLMPLSIIFGWPAILGVTIGAGLGNFVGDTVSGLSGSSTGVDVVGGSLANLLAAFLAWKIGGRHLTGRGRNVSWLLAVNTETVVIALIVGSYLGWIFSTPLWFSIAFILAGSIVAISLGGYLLLRVLGRPKTIEAFNSMGLLASQPVSGNDV